MCNACTSGNLILFADDANHYETGADFFEVLNQINTNLIQIAEWFLANKLAINLIKTEAMVLSRKQLWFPLPPVILSNEPVPYNYVFKFLGLLVDFKLNWKSHITAIRAKLSSVCGIIYRIRNKITRSIAKLVYNSIAHPHITYCNVIWASAYTTNLNCLRVSQKKLIRSILKKRRDVHTSPLFKELNILKIDDVCNLCCLTFVYKSLNNLIFSPITFTIRELRVYNIRNPVELIVPFYRSRQSMIFILARGANLWNNTPEVF